MNPFALLDKSLSVCITAVANGPMSGERTDTTSLARQFVQLAASGDALAKSLALAPEELSMMCAELQRLEGHASLDGSVALPRELAAWRALDWFNTAREKGSSLALPHIDEVSPSDRTTMFEQVYAIETLCRSIYQETLGEDLAVITDHLRKHMKDKAFKEAMRRAVKAKPLTGLELNELISLFVRPDRWPTTGRVYEAGELIEFLGSKRETVECFLQDVRRIRNRVVHGKPVTAVHHRMLKSYYQALVGPIRNAFNAITQVDARLFEHPAQAELDQYRRDVIRQDRQLASIQLMASVGLAIVIALAALSLPVLLPILQDKFDPARHDIEQALASPQKIGGLAVSYCTRGQLDVVQRLAQLPGAASSLKSEEADGSYVLLMALAASDPDRLAACLPLLHQMGWNPNVLGRTTVGNDFDSTQGTRAPQGYRSYLQTYAQGLMVGARRVDATELIGSPLLYAVWHGHVPLVKALLAAGGDAHQKLFVSGAWLGQHDDVPMLEVVDEARRIGDPAILDLLTHQSATEPGLGKKGH
jgi:hypothetical protein